MGKPRFVVASVLDFDTVVSMFEPAPCYYVHFPTNNLGKGIVCLITQINCGGALDVIVIVVRNEHGDMNSNPGRNW